MSVEVLTSVLILENNLVIFEELCYAYNRQPSNPTLGYVPQKTFIQIYKEAYMGGGVCPSNNSGSRYLRSAYVSPLKKWKG